MDLLEDMLLYFCILGACVNGLDVRLNAMLSQVNFSLRLTISKCFNYKLIWEYDEPALIKKTDPIYW